MKMLDEALLRIFTRTAEHKISCLHGVYMSLSLKNLDDQTRQLMLEEIDLDVSQNTLYISSRLSNAGRNDYPALLKEAASRHDDRWLAGQLRSGGRLNLTETRRTPKGGTTTAQVPVTAADTLAEGEFNRFYIRALCRRAVDSGSGTVTVYRAKQVERARSESGRKIGTQAEQVISSFKIAVLTLDQNAVVR